ncbi:hypothetical protein TNIN_365931 [Trichonephila inaurata madagascariensis]|uniref:Uncharacterized protein n=1 Tax=Trichonephila inaurata madagascariensis TaxID=2747483 RepID=A0A8X7BTS2_9ARAC|nr:hypothetical protein TNIN_365931 [Trichonephila inaurata madagascariensis]
MSCLSRTRTSAYDIFDDNYQAHEFWLIDEGKLNKSQLQSNRFFKKKNYNFVQSTQDSSLVLTGQEYAEPTEIQS